MAKCKALTGSAVKGLISSCKTSRLKHCIISYLKDLFESANNMNITDIIYLQWRCKLSVITNDLLSSYSILLLKYALTSPPLKQALWN